MKHRRTDHDARVRRYTAPGATPRFAVIGLEAEFNLLINGRRQRPEKVFGDPSRLVRRRMIPRTGNSFQLPAGGAIYFDTGVIEVPVEFTPEPALMLATCAFIAGVVETVLRWQDFGLRQLVRHEIPRMARFRLLKHSSRRGWRVTADSLGQDPFAADMNKTLWKLRDGRSLSLRAIAAGILRPFHRRIRQISDP